ncbi:hypothetical protein [Pseudoclavibacter sp. CFCC 14310]|uniref:hypothetical protein n=1 Tax=Pseudoclavibacter sp. CFCC 14310 TaxID=2615180 RepID=UPI0017883081|nr:hypothetical protein [Pseudoclavibacter sp. CFCC 14310]
MARVEIAFTVPLYVCGFDEQQVQRVAGEGPSVSAAQSSAEARLPDDVDVVDYCVCEG